MLTRRIVQSTLAVLALVALLCQGTMVLAGTTGQLSGTVVDSSTNAPLVGAKVTAASPSQIATSTTDSGGHFSFLALAPDTYTVSVEQAGFEATSISGVTIQADNTRTLSVPVAKELKTIGTVRSRSASSLVKPGTTSDVYSIDATQQTKVSAAGGGGTQDSAFSAVSTVPGVFVAPGQNGYIGAGATLSIRGGDYDQIGYEIDGVPVNRAFDDYPSGPTSSLGQQELQVYTGGGPASSEAQGLSGFINQVIRTGTYPGFLDATAAIGGPTFYHKTAIEFGGATTSRNFSYYVGIGGYDQDFRVDDNFNGLGVGALYGPPIAPCPSVATPGVNPVSIGVAPSCFVNGRYAGTNAAGKVAENAYNAYFGTTNAYVLGPNNAFLTSEVIDRDNVLNLHFGIPRKNGLKDDIQVLGMVNFLKTYYYDSTNDLGGASFLSAIGYSGPSGVPFYNGLVFNSPTGVPLPANYRNLISTYYYPNSGSANNSLGGANAVPFGATIPNGLEDNTINNQGIMKVQYTHPFSQGALVKLYGYTYYSDWLQQGAQSAYADFFGPSSADYELSSHTRGVSGTFIDQLNSQNLLQLEGSYTTSNTLRDNNTEMFNYFGGLDERDVLGYVVDSSNPTNGLCYGAHGGKAYSCYSSTDPIAVATLPEAQNGAITPASGTCGNGPCEYLVTGNGLFATYNTVKPIFYAASLTDDFHPNSKLTINGGLRMDIYQFQGASTTGTAARTFFYNAFNQDYCLSPLGALDPIEPGAGCAKGDSPANFVNPSGTVTESYTEFQPRLGATYSLDRSTVLRAGYGRYTQAPNSAYQQYNTLSQNSPQILYNVYGFQQYGFTSPDHTVRPPTSNNYDFSLEHQFPNQLALKISPFYRKTADQIQNFFLNQQTGFVSGLNVGRQTSRGVEFELDKGDFSRDGLSAKLSFTYTNSYINYQTLQNGSNIISPINASIADYNAYTSACAVGGSAYGKSAYGLPLCGSIASGTTASPCYAAGKAVPCSAAGAVANPYWNAPVQGFLDPTANYPTFDTFPAGVGSAVNGYGAPYNGSLILNYKKGPLAITPILQIYGGQRYGAPETTDGVNPELCGALAGATTAGDPRYPYGSAGGAPFDATSCTVSGFVIPNPYTKTFDGIGAFVAPAEMQLHMQLTYDLSKRVQLVANLSNLLSTCFGGTKVPWSVSGTCGYTVLAGGSTGDIGNQYNPGAAIQPYVNTPYTPTFASTTPFNVYVSAHVKL